MSACLARMLGERQPRLKLQRWPGLAQTAYVGSGPTRFFEGKAPECHRMSGSASSAVVGWKLCTTGR
jgi:hypothetical protein